MDELGNVRLAEAAAAAAAACVVAAAARRRLMMLVPVLVLCCCWLMLWSVCMCRMLVELVAIELGVFCWAVLLAFGTWSAW